VAQEHWIMHLFRVSLAFLLKSKYCILAFCSQSSSARKTACEMPSCEMIRDEKYSFECSFLLNICGNKRKYFRENVYNICFVHDNDAL